MSCPHDDSYRIPNGAVFCRDCGMKVHYPGAPALDLETARQDIAQNPEVGILTLVLEWAPEWYSTLAAIRALDESPERI